MLSNYLMKQMLTISPFFIGAAAEVRYLDGEQINILQESDLKFALKEVKTLIIAADALQSGKTKGFFDKGIHSSKYLHAT